MTTNIEQFLKSFKANQVLALKASHEVIMTTIQDMYQKIIDRTPVGNPSLWSYKAPPDYEPGQLKNSWTLSFSGIQRKVDGIHFQSMSDLMAGHGIGTHINQEITISNPQPYAQRVENGWSTQAPQGMMRVTIAEYTSLMNRNAAAYRIK